MSASRTLLTQDPANLEIQQLLTSASQQPWGTGRELDAKIYQLHQELLAITIRLGTEEERPEDALRAERIDHELRNKLTVFRFYDDMRKLASMKNIDGH